MSFGTGHHATTQLMVEAMLTLDLKGKRVLDMGSGTGVLAIVAAKLGAKSVLAVEIDEMSEESVRENITLNDVEDRVISVRYYTCQHQPQYIACRYESLLRNPNKGW